MKLKTLILTLSIFMLSLSTFSSNGENYVEKKDAVSPSYLNEMSFLNQQSFIPKQFTTYVLNPGEIFSYSIHYHNWVYSHYPTSNTSAFTQGFHYFVPTETTKLVFNNAKISASDPGPLKIRIERISGANYSVLNNGTTEVTLLMAPGQISADPYIVLSFEK